MNRRGTNPSRSAHPWESDSLAGGPSDEAVHTFLESAAVFDNEHFCGGPYMPEAYFEPMFRYWLTESGGFRIMRGDFSIFLEAAHRIMDIVSREPRLLWFGSKPRRVLGVFGPDSESLNCLDPRKFEALKFEFIMKHAASGNPFW